MSDTLSGFLLWHEPTTTRDVVSRLTRLKKEQGLIDGWLRYDYITDEQISKVDAEGLPPFTHQLFARWGKDRLILLSNTYRVCDHFIERDLRPAIASLLRKADIAVHDLVLSMMDFHLAVVASVEGKSDARLPPPLNAEWTVEWQEFNERHTLSYASARTDAFEGALQKIEFEGEDLPAAALFAGAVPVVRFRNCGFRRKTSDEQGASSSYELLRLGKTGFLSFTMPGSARGRRDRFKEVEAVLRNLNKFGFIK
jgi:hypothetical protein